MPAVSSLDPNYKPPTKQTQNLPYIEDGHLLTNTQPPKQDTTPANPTQSDLQQGSSNVMGAAQNLALNNAQQPNQTMGLVESQTNKLLQNPQIQSDAYVQNQLAQYDKNRADQMQAFQSQYADVANTGVQRENAYNFAMEGAQGRSNLQATAENAQAEANRKSLLDALNLGQTTAATKAGLDTSKLNDLLNTRSGFEGERSQTAQYAYDEKKTGVENAQALLMQSKDQEGQQALATLQGKISMGQLLTTQDFASTQAAIDRQLKVAMQSTDIQAQKDLTALKGQIDMQAQQAQIAASMAIAGMNNDSAQKIASMNIASDEKINAAKDALTQQGLTIQQAQLQGYTDPTTGKHVAGSAELAQQGMTLEQAKVLGYTAADGTHIAGAAEIAAGQLGLQSKTLDLQTQELFGYNDANGNRVNGKIDSMNAQDKLAANSMYGYTDASGNHIPGSLELGAADNKQKADALYGYTGSDGVHHDGSMQMAQDQLLLSKAEQAMAQAGMNFAQIQSEVDAGRLDPTAAVNQIKVSLQNQGIDTTNLVPQDQSTAAANAINQMYDSNLQQFGLTHPELTGDALKKAYNDYFNQTVYPAATTAADLISDPTKLQGGAVAGNPNNEAYTKLVESATPSSSFTMGYKMEKGDRKFTGSKPADGSIIKDSKGRVWMGTASSGTDVYDGKDTDWIEMRDVNSGAVVRIWANHGLNEQLISSNITPPETVNTGSGGSINLNGSSN